MIYDIIGTIYKPSGVFLTDGDGIEYNEMVASEGYHINTLAPLDEKLNEFIVVPTTPSRVFAGRDDTICLKFNSRDEWLAQGYETIEEDTTL